MTLVMQDSAINASFTPGADAYAGYVDGSLGDQPNYGWIVTAFPGAHHVAITVTGQAGAHAAAVDDEGGALTSPEATGWAYGRAQAGQWRPIIYASVSTMANVVSALDPAGLHRQDVRLWSAHYGAGAHICGPASCGETPVDMDGTQYTDTYQGRNLDASLLLDDFFGGRMAYTVKTPPPGTWELPLVALSTGTDGQLWQAVYDPATETWSVPARV